MIAAITPPLNDDPLEEEDSESITTAVVGVYVAGAREGLADGLDDGLAEGLADGLADGLDVGLPVGTADGE